MKISARSTFDKLVFNKDSEVHLVVSLAAPLLDWVAKRPSIAIMLVADVSGSMGGSKLSFAKESMSKLVDHLQPNDYCGLATFENTAKLVSAPAAMTSEFKTELKKQIAALCPLGGTAFTDGMIIGLKECNASQIPEGVLKRAIIFTDGQANVGIKGKEILPLVEKHLGKASLSAFGYGDDADQELLADVSSKGNGNYAFIKSPDVAPAAFAKELGGLLSTYAQNIKVEVTSLEGSQILEMLSELPKVIDNKTISVSVPEILSEETRNFVFSLKCFQLSQADKIVNPISGSLAKVRVTFDLVNQDGTRTNKTENVDMMAEFVNPGDEQKSPHDDLDHIVALAEMAHAQVQAENLAKQGNYTQAYTVMTDVSAILGNRGHEAISMTASKLGSKMKDSFSYTSSQSYRTSSYAASSRGMGISSLDAEAAEDMKSIGIVMTNTAQEEVTKSFVAPVIVPDATITPPDSSESK